MSKANLLPLSRRPTMRPCLLKKRPQSLLYESTSSPTLLKPTSPALVSPIQSLSSSSVKGDIDHYHHRSHDHGESYQSTSSCSSTSSSNSGSNKRIKFHALIQRWDVGTSIQDLPKVPMFHLSPPMTHFRIKEDELRALGQVKGDASVANGNGSSSNSSTASCATITPNDITSKIVECVMAMSAVAQYNGNKASAVVQTMNGITFSISLFNDESVHGNCVKNDILIDIERKKGDTIQFHWIVKSIFDSLKQLISEFRDSSSTASFPNSNGTTRRSSTMKNEDLNSKVSSAAAVAAANYQDSNYTISASDNDHFHSAMETICTLLRKDRLDATLLGMESLAFLTNNSYSSNESISYLASRTVLVDADSPWQFVRDEIIDLIDFKNKNDDVSDDRGTNTSATIITRLESKMQHMAFKVLANSLYTMKTSTTSKDSLNSSTTYEKSYFIKENMDEWKEIFTCLVQQMKSSKHELAAKFQIALCIHYLMSMDDDMKVEAMKLNVSNLMVQYHQDNCMHRGLVEVCKSIIDSLNQCK